MLTNRSLTDSIKKHTDASSTLGELYYIAEAYYVPMWNHQRPVRFLLANIAVIVASLQCLQKRIWRTTQSRSILFLTNLWSNIISLMTTIYILLSMWNFWSLVFRTKKLTNACISHFHGASNIEIGMSIMQYLLWFFNLFFYFLKTEKQFS